LICSFVYLAISLFPEASGEEKNRCVGPRARARARAFSSPQHRSSILG